jgi:uncharacterized protein YaiL (DUF2058 family)
MRVKAAGEDFPQALYGRDGPRLSWAPMQNLRDKLLKAGLVTEKQAKDAERKDEKPAGAQHRTAKERASPATGGAPAGAQHRTEEAVSEEERQRRDAFALREAELSEDRRKDAAKKAEARMQSERAHRLRHLVETHRVREAPGEVDFHFVKRSGKIGRLAVSPETAKLLEGGKAAVVEDPGQPEHAVVPGEAAKRIYEVDPQAIRFWFGPEKPIGFEVE